MESSKDILPSSPRKEEIAACIENQFGGPIVSHFCPDFGAPMTSPWNKKVAAVFLGSFKESLGMTDMDDTTIVNEFSTYFQHLRTRYKQQQEPTPKVNDRRNARRMQKNKLLECRKKGCYRFSQLDRFAELLEMMGADGMSDDESDYKTGNQTGNRGYKVTTVWWRSKSHQLLGFLELLDLLYMSMKFRLDGTPQAGNWPRVRVCQEQEPQYKPNPVAGLPENMYDEVWLQELKRYDPSALDDLMVKPPVDLTIDPRIVE